MAIDKTVMTKEYKNLLDDAIEHIKTMRGIIGYEVRYDGLFINKMHFDGVDTTYMLNIKVLKRYAKIYNNKTRGL